MNTHDTIVAFANAPLETCIDPNAAPWHTHWTRTCKHVLVPRIKPQSNGVKRAKMQCIKCGAGVGNSVPSAGVDEPWDYALEGEGTRSYQDAVTAWSERKASAQIHRHAEWMRVYGQYLKSEVWRSKRRMVLMRANNTCECCGVRKAEQVHHLKPYPEVFGHEPLWTLRAVCIRCHALIHPNRDFVNA